MVCFILSVSYFISKLNPIHLDLDIIYKLLYTKTLTQYANSFIIYIYIYIHQRLTNCCDNYAKDHSSTVSHHKLLSCYAVTNRLFQMKYRESYISFPNQMWLTEQSWGKVDLFVILICQIAIWLRENISNCWK